MPSGTLTFIGLGLHDEEGVTRRGLREIEKSDVVFADAYTSCLSPGSLDRLGGATGRKIIPLGREAVEDGTVILEACRSNRVAFLVAGDPMSATTHVDLRLRAEKLGISTRIEPGVSIMCAAPGLLGLQLFKFGRSTSLPFRESKYTPLSPYEIISENLAQGWHTLVLLDLDVEHGRFMTANEALMILLEMENQANKKSIGPDTTACVVARAGSPNVLTKAGGISELIRMDFGPPLHTVVIPGRLHFMELDSLETIAGLRERGSRFQKSSALC